MNGILIVDKPPDYTSHDVVAKLRGILRERRIGHSGTLDPMATGVLAVFVGRATRAVQFAENDGKEYIAGLRPCLVTTTADITGEVLRTGERKPTREELLAVLPRFTGDILQTPPMYSAVKVGGERLYKLARRGETVAREPRPVKIKTLELLGEEDGDYLLRVICSKGTYIRTLCEDIGEALGCGACMSYLRRTRAGAFGIERATTLDEIERAALRGDSEGLLAAVDTLFADKESLTLTPEQERKVRNGSAVDASGMDGEYRVYSEGGEFLALAELGKGMLRVIKSFYEV